MIRKRTWWAILGVLAVAVIGAAGVGGFLLYKKPQPAEKQQPGEPSKDIYDTAFTAWNWTFHLRAIRPEQVGDATVEQVWRNLFPGMAKDPITRDLLRQLHGGLPVEFVVVAPEAAKDKSLLQAPPSEGHAIVMRVADLQSDKRKTSIGELPFKLVGYGRKHYISDAVIPTAPDLASGLETLSAAMREEPQPGGALTLAIEDYVFRHAPGWVLGGPHFDQDQKLPASPDEQRAELDGRIRAYAEHANAYYGALRKPQ